MMDPKHVGVILNVCLLDFYTTQILTSTTVSIECISCLIQVTNNNDARWKPEIKTRNNWGDVNKLSILKKLLEVLSASQQSTFKVAFNLATKL
jgi:hypothetical protein